MAHSHSGWRWCSGRIRGWAGRAAAALGRSRRRRRRQRGRARRPPAHARSGVRWRFQGRLLSPARPRPGQREPKSHGRARPPCCSPTARREAEHRRPGRLSSGDEKRRLDPAPPPAGPAALTGSALVVAPPLLRLGHGRSGARLGSRGPSPGLGLSAPPRPGISDNQPIEEQERFLLQRLCEADFSGRVSGGDWREQAEGELAAKAEIPVEARERSRCIFLLSDTRG